MLGRDVRKWECERVPCPSGAFTQFFKRHKKKKKSGRLAASKRSMSSVNRMQITLTKRGMASRDNRVE